VTVKETWPCRPNHEEYPDRCISMRPGTTLISADEHTQTSVSEHGDRHSPQPAGPRRRRSSTPGRSSWTRNHPPPESVFPRARHGRSLPRCGELAFRTPTRHRARTGNLEGS
jgi:hypothetical protein